MKINIQDILKPIMSLAPVHFPQHIFTSTMTDHRIHHSGFNVWMVLLTAIFFFTVLAWFNFALAFYGTITTTDCDHDDQTMSTLGFAIVWTVTAIAIYYAMEWSGVLGGGDNLRDSEHPVLMGEGRAAVDPSDVGIGDYIGDINIGAV